MNLQTLITSWKSTFDFAPANAPSSFQFAPSSLDIMFDQGTKVIYLLDYRTFKLLYVSPNIASHLGVTAQQLLQQGFRGLLPFYQQNDLQRNSQRLNQDFQQAYFAIDPTRRRDLKISYSYLLRRPGGQSFSCLHETYFLELDSRHRPIIGMNLLSDLQQINHHPMFSLGIYLRERDSMYHPQFFRFFPPDTLNDLQFTRRELEVITHIAQGFTSPEIARRLGITVNTLYTHRRRLLKKFVKGSMMELISYAINRGLIDPLVYLPPKNSK